jgi:hypothetical protein
MITGNVLLAGYFVGGVAVGLIMRATATWTRLGIYAGIMSTVLVIGMEVIK